MRVVYYTHPAFLEPALHLARQLAERVELHVLLEISPSSWQSAAFDIPKERLEPGLMAADPVLSRAFPVAVREYWRGAATFHLVVHGERRSIHPRTLVVGREVLRAIRRIGPDVVHVDDTDVSPRLALVSPALAGGPPIVLSVHDPRPHLGETDWRKTLARRLLYARARRFVLYAERFRRPFAQDARVSIDRVRSVRLAPYDIFRCWADRPVEQDERLAVSVGRLSRYKGLGILAGAAWAASQRVPDLRVIVAGQPVPGYTPPPVPALARGGRFDLRAAYLSDRELVDIVRSAAIVVCPYLDASQSGAVLTAFGLGRPVITTTAGALPEYVTHEVNGLLVPPGDVSALSDALVGLLSDPDRRRRLEAGVVGGAGQSDWRAVADGILAVYGEAAGS